MGLEDARAFGVPGIFDNARDGLVLLRFPERKVVLFNRAASQIFGIPAEEAIGAPLDSLLDGPEVAERAAASADEPVGEWPGHEQEPMPVHLNGDGDLEVSFCRVDDVGTGGPLVLLVVRHGPLSELAAMARKGATARRRVDELERKARELALFFGEAAHEFNTPLTVVLLQSKLLHQSLGPLTPLQEKALARIDSNVHRLMLLSQDLMDLARADAGKLILKPAEVDLADAVEREVRNFRDLARQQGVTLESRPPSGPVLVTGEAVRLRQVLANLIGNAIKFTPEGGRVEVRTEEADGRAAVTVRDDGRGMAPDDVGRLFRPFVRIAAADMPRKPGTGLGLYLSKRIVEAHGGQVAASSAGPGQGMEFRFEVPLAHEAAHAPARARPSRRAGRPGHAARPGGRPAAPEQGPVRATSPAQGPAGRRRP